MFTRVKNSSAADGRLASNFHPQSKSFLNCRVWDWICVIKRHRPPTNQPPCFSALRALSQTGWYRYHREQPWRGWWPHFINTCRSNAVGWDEVTQSKQKTTNTLRLLLRPSLSFPISQSLSHSRTLALRVSIQLSLIRISHADAQPLFHVAKRRTLRVQQPAVVQRNWRRKWNWFLFRS